MSFILASMFCVLLLSLIYRTRISVFICLTIFKTFLTILDFLTLLPSTLLSLPFWRWRAARALRAHFVGDDLMRIKQPKRYPLFKDAQTIPQLVDNAIRKYRTRPCSGVRRVLSNRYETTPSGKVHKKFLLDDHYEYLTYNEVDIESRKIAYGLRTLADVQIDEKVIIFCETRQEWLLSAMAVLHCGATIVTLYPALGNSGILHVIRESEAKTIITSGDLLIKLSTLSNEIENLQYVVCIDSLQNARKELKASITKLEAKMTSCIQYDQLRTAASIAKVEPSLPSPAIDPNSPAVIMYTSGSTGTPKGVLLSHRNIIEAIHSMYATFIADYRMDKEECFLAYLPLAHIFELTFELLMLVSGVKLAYSSPLTMTDDSTGLESSCLGDLSVEKPTITIIVPLILERTRRLMESKLAPKDNPLQVAIFRYLLSRKQFWTRWCYETPISDFIFFRSIRQLMGGRLKLVFVGSAPLLGETQAFAANVLGIRLLQGYASTECAAATTMMDLNDQSFGRVGSVLPAVRVRLEDWPEGGYRRTDTPPRGEILIGGPSLSVGYYKNPQATEENFVVLDGQRYWRSGDIGIVHPDGTLQIIDRKKDLVKLQQGEYISLGKVEASLKMNKYVENICVYGNGYHNYLVALVSPNWQRIKSLADELGIPVDHSTINQMVLEDIRKDGVANGLSSIELPTKLKICEEEWTPESELVTAALKLRRRQIYEYYKKDLDALCANS